MAGGEGDGFAGTHQQRGVVLEARENLPSKPHGR